jgi:hypothetical protein
MSNKRKSESGAAVAGAADGWAASQIWPSLESITLKCPRPLAGSGGYHWWYNDHEEMEEHYHNARAAAETEDEDKYNYVPIICKSCGLKLKLSADAPEYPAI